jgi:hypothetical protein
MGTFHSLGTEEFMSACACNVYTLQIGVSIEFTVQEKISFGVDVVVMKVVRMVLCNLGFALPRFSSSAFYTSRSCLFCCNIRRK